MLCPLSFQTAHLSPRERPKCGQAEEHPRAHIRPIHCGSVSCTDLCSMPKLRPNLGVQLRSTNAPVCHGCRKRASGRKNSPNHFV